VRAFAGVEMCLGEGRLFPVCGSGEAILGKRGFPPGGAVSGAPVEGLTGGRIGVIMVILAVAGWSSQVARRAHNPKVAGSNPAPAIEEDPAAAAGRLFDWVEIRSAEPRRRSAGSGPGRGHGTRYRAR
jgi:hypothetical protein